MHRKCNQTINGQEQLGPTKLACVRPTQQRTAHPGGEVDAGRGELRQRLAAPPRSHTRAGPGRLLLLPSLLLLIILLLLLLLPLLLRFAPLCTLCRGPRCRLSRVPCGQRGAAGCSLASPQGGKPAFRSALPFHRFALCIRRQPLPSRCACKCSQPNASPHFPHTPPPQTHSSHPQPHAATPTPHPPTIYTYTYTHPPTYAAQTHNMHAPVVAAAPFLRFWPLSSFTRMRFSLRSPAAGQRWHQGATAPGLPAS